MKVLVIIPAYNERETIRTVIANLKAVKPEYDYVVVNDCSRDDTRQILIKEGFNFIDLPVNLGIGGGVQTGYRYAVAEGYDIAVQMDGDGQHDPQFLDAVVSAVADGKLDMCVGSRFIDKEGFQTSFMRRLGINFLSMLIKICCGVRVKDTTSGFRATNARLTEYFSNNYAQDYPEPEAIVSAVMAGFTVGEAPVVMRDRQGGSSSINAFRSIYYMIKVSLAVLLCRVTHRRSKR